MFVLEPSVIPADLSGHAAWFTANIPLFECPEPIIQEIYYFRWDVYRKHLKDTLAGFVVTEFLPDVPWAGVYNTISCAAGHHLYEGRWLHTSTYLDDYATFWFRPDATPRRYSCWLADAIYARYLVTDDARLPLDLLDDLIANYEAWETEHLAANGLFWQLDDRDGMEFQISGSGCRPTINSYMYGDAVAIAHMAEMAGRADVAILYRGKAAEIKALTQEKLWDAKALFFKTLPTQVAVDEHWTAGLYQHSDLGPWYPDGTLTDVRELQGYLPWYFNLPDPGYEAGWAQLTDHEGFFGAYGPSTAERRHPYWLPAPSVHLHDCLWRGSSWPYATAQTLNALANLLNNYQQDLVSAQDYIDLIRIYARSHHRTQLDGNIVPWIDESLHPDTNEWVTRATLYARDDPNKDRGRDYNHSTFCDLVITGLVGLRPRSGDALEVKPLLPEGTWEYFCLDHVRYHGHTLTILYDRTGHRYGKGTGLRVYADGQEIGRTSELGHIMAHLPG